MESKIIEIAAFDQIDISSYTQIFKPDEEALKKEVMFLRAKNSIWEEVKTATEGCIGIFDMESEHPFFQRKDMKVMIGQGFFHAKIEELCVGMEKGSEKEMEVNGTKVKVYLKSVKQKRIPELSDEMCRKLEIEGVTDCVSYRAYLIQKQKEEVFREKGWEVVRYVIDQVCRKSRFEIRKEDWKRTVEYEINRIRVIARLEGLELEKMTPEEFEGKIPVSSYYELLAMIQDDTWDKLYQYLLGYHYAKQAGVTFEETDYRKAIDEYREMWNNTKEEAEEIFPYEYQEILTYENYFYKQVQDYVKENYFVEEKEDGDSACR